MVLVQGISESLSQTVAVTRVILEASSLLCLVPELAGPEQLGLEELGLLSYLYVYGISLHDLCSMVVSV